LPQISPSLGIELGADQVRFLRELERRCVCLRIVAAQAPTIASCTRIAIFADAIL